MFWPIEMFLFNKNNWTQVRKSSSAREVKAIPVPSLLSNSHANIILALYAFSFTHFNTDKITPTVRIHMGIKSTTIKYSSIWLLYLNYKRTFASNMITRRNNCSSNNKHTSPRLLRAVYWCSPQMKASNLIKNDVSTQNVCASLFLIRSSRSKYLSFPSISLCTCLSCSSRRVTQVVMCWIEGKTRLDGTPVAWPSQREAKIRKCLNVSLKWLFL
jgi:hypothetical protein